jgi:hypothetical protein
MCSYHQAGYRTLNTKTMNIQYNEIQNSSVGIANCYRLDGPGIESRRGRDFPHLSRPVLGSTQPPIQWVPGLSKVWICGLLLAGTAGSNPAGGMAVCLL